MADRGSQVGQLLGNYRLVRLLGQGGFAEVYLGEHIHLDTQAAVKLLYARLASEDVEKFRDEARMIARLLHPHIVRILDFGVERGAPYLVMDFAPNGTLRHRHPKGTRVPLPTVAIYVKQVAEALQYAHSQRLIHRDVKPENMLLGRNNEVLLSDFGIALTAQSTSFMSPQDVAGTIVYMAPEQIQAHPRPASDQYSLGIVVYEWLGGNRPFQGTYSEVAIKHTTVSPPPLRGLVPDLPPAVEEVVMIALRKDPHQRFPDVRAFASALEQASLQGQSYASRSFYSTAPFVPPAPILTQTPSTLPGMQPHQQTPNTAGVGYVNDAYGVQPLQHSAYSTLPPYTTANTPAPYAPALQAPDVSTSARPPTQTPRRFPRRVFMIGGTVGLVAVGGIAADVILNHVTQSLLTPLKQAFSNTPNTGSTQNIAQATPELTHQLPAQAWIVRWSPDGKYIASSSLDGTMQVWTADTGETRLSVRSTVQPAISDDYPWSIAWSPRKDQKVAVSFVDGTVQVLDASDGQRLSSLNTPASVVAMLTWSPDERYLAVGGSDNKVRVYTYPGWNIVTTYQDHTDAIKALAWAPNGQTIASGSADTTVRLWEPLSGHTKLIYQGHSNTIGSLSWSSDSTRIVSTAFDQTAKVWQVSTGTTLYTYNAPGGAPIGEASWSHNDRTIAVYGGDANIYLLDAQTGKVQGSYFTGVVFSLSWSPDDTRIVTGSYNKVAQIWRIG
jgi:eukaryotic-like serine/threonine-protein kinase